jgi:hypothetical protein
MGLIAGRESNGFFIMFAFRTVQKGFRFSKFFPMCTDLKWSDESCGNLE